MQSDVFTGFTCAISVYGIVVSLLLLFYRSCNTYSKRLLGISILSCSLCCFMAAGIGTTVPLISFQLFRVSIPWLYLAAPTSFLCVRAALNNQTGPQKYDWVHFIPFLLFCFELLPFYLKHGTFAAIDTSYYLTLTGDVIYLPAEIFEKYFHVIARAVLALVYGFLQWRVIYRFLSAASIKVKIEYLSLINWLQLYTLLTSVTFGGVILVVLFHVYFKNPGNAINLIMLVNLLIVLLMLILRPRLLYNFNQEFIVENVSKPILTPAKQNELEQKKQLIDELLQIQKRYMIKGYSLAAMAAELHIPARVVSAIINSEYQMSFTDLINKYRIDHIINNTTEEKISSYTLEAIASEAGFNSRITFYRAFMKVIGRSPTAYFKMMDK